MSNRATNSSKTKQGAGVLVVARRMSLYPGKSILLGQRSRNVRSPLTWASHGGWIEPGEEPEVAAMREFAEESGYHGPVELIENSHWEHRIGLWPFVSFIFHNYIGVVETQFAPTGVPNWEVADTRWMSLEEIDSLTRPGLLSPYGVEGGIHPGLQAYLQQPDIRALLTELCQHAMGT